MMITNDPRRHTLRCDICGRFISYDDMDSGKAIHHFTGRVTFCGDYYDDDYYECRSCIEKYKPIEMKKIPEERVNEIREKISKLVEERKKEVTHDN